MELWEKAFKILGKSREARLMVLGILLMTSGGGTLYALQAVGISSPVSALLFVFGILSFISGFGLYYEKAEKGSRA